MGYVIFVGLIIVAICGCFYWIYRLKKEADDEYKRFVDALDLNNRVETVKFLAVAQESINKMKGRDSQL